MTTVQSTWTAIDGRTRTMRKGRTSYFVLKECASHFEAELIRIRAVEDLARTNAGAGLFRRLAIAAQFYDLQRDIYSRRKGIEAARRIARHCVVMWILPRWLGLRLQERGYLQPPKEADIHAQENQVP
jgi:hypothetical protein